MIAESSLGERHASTASRLGRPANLRYFVHISVAHAGPWDDSVQQRLASLESAEEWHAGLIWRTPAQNKYASRIGFTLLFDSDDAASEYIEYKLHRLKEAGEADIQIDRFKALD